MSPRNNRIIAFTVIWFLMPGLLSAAYAGAGTHPLFYFYKKVISPVDGNRCPMHPSCSAYASQSIEKHGVVIGWIMACDRIQRCGRDTMKLAPVIKIDNQAHTYDPVAANDFWWFEKKGAD